MGESADAQSATTGAMAEEEEEVADYGKTVAFARDGVTALARTAGRTSLAREAGGTSLVRAHPHGYAGLPPLLPPPRRNEDQHQDKGAGGF